MLNVEWSPLTVEKTPNGARLIRRIRFSRAWAASASPCKNETEALTTILLEHIIDVGTFIAGNGGTPSAPRLEKRMRQTEDVLEFVVTTKVTSPPKKRPWWRR